MKKTRTRMTRARRRAQLLQVARRIVANEGGGALSMTALAEAAEVGKPVVYSHFKNRQEVAVALLDEHYEGMRLFVRNATEGAATVDEYISQMLEAAFNYERTSDTPIRKITNGFSADPEINDAFLRYGRLFRAYWSDLLRQQGVPTAVAEILAHGYASMINDITVEYSIVPRKQKLACDTLKKVLLASIEKLSTAPTPARPNVHIKSYRVVESSTVPDDDEEMPA